MGKNYEFKQAVRVDRQSFPLGIREVPAEIEKHPHFKIFLSSGAVRVAGASQTDKQLSDLKTLPLASSTAAKRSKEAADGVLRAEAAKAAAKAAGDVAPESTIGEPLQADAPGAESLDELPVLKKAGGVVDQAPDEEIGGSDEEELHDESEEHAEEASDEADDAKPAHHGKKKKGKGK